MIRQDRKNLSIVIPVFNRESIIERTLNSVAAQTACHEVELIVIDNNSSDRSAEVVSDWMESHPEVSTRFARQTKRGAAAARNLGLQMVVTPWVMFFDSDDVMLPSHISTILEAIEKNPDSDIVGWNINQQLPSGKRHIAKFTTVRPMVSHLIHATLATQRFAARTELVVNAGGWNETAEGWNDYELGVRLLLKKPKMVKIKTASPNVITYFTERSITGRTFSDNPCKWEHSLDIIEKHLADSAPEYLPWIAYRRAVLSADYRREGAKEESDRLLAKACSREIIPYIIYLHHRFIHRGAYVIARIFM